MRMVCLETTDRTGSIALLADGETVAEKSLTGPSRTAQTFAPSLRQLVEAAGWEFAKLDQVAVAAGPGSFTGLRIGVTAAKTLAYVTGSKLLGVNTLDAIAWRYFCDHPDNDSPLWTVLDAQRSQLFVARYERSEDRPLKFAMTTPTAVLDIDDWLGQAVAGECVSGPGLHKIAKDLPLVVQAVPEELWQPTAAAVGHVAEVGFAEGRSDDPFQLVPQYYRLSAAEEKRAEREV